MSTIRNANVATVAAQYPQEYRTPCRPSIAFLSTRLRMERLSLLRPVAVKRLLRRRGGLRSQEALGLSEADPDRGHPAASRTTARDHAIGDIVDARPLDAPAGQIKLGDRVEDLGRGALFRTRLVLAPARALRAQRLEVAYLIAHRSRRRGRRRMRARRRAARAAASSLTPPPWGALAAAETEPLPCGIAHSARRAPSHSGSSISSELHPPGTDDEALRLSTQYGQPHLEQAEEAGRRRLAAPWPRGGPGGTLLRVPPTCDRRRHP